MAAKFNKPEHPAEVFNVMKDYCVEKRFNLTEANLTYLSEDMFLHFESKNWSTVPYWPAAAKRWILNHVTKFGSQIKQQVKQEQKPKQGPSIRQQLMETTN